MLHPGLYEQVVNNTLNSEPAEIPEARKSLVSMTSKVLSQHLSDVVQKGLENVLDN